MYQELGLPEPWLPVAEGAEPTPLVIYGAASAVGAYAVQLARRSNIHPLITVAGKSAPHVEALIDRSKGDTIIDYRDGDEAVVEGIQKAAGGRRILHALDAVANATSVAHLGTVLAEGGRLTTVLPPPEGTAEAIAHLKTSWTKVGDAHEGAKDFSYVYLRFLARGLHEGWFKPQPQVVVPGGLGGIQKALDDLKAGRVNGVKYVFRIADTEGGGK